MRQTKVETWDMYLRIFHCGIRRQPFSVNYNSTAVGQSDAYIFLTSYYGKPLLESSELMKRYVNIEFVNM